MSRRVIIVVLVALLAITAGCTSGDDAGNGNGLSAGNGDAAGNGNGNGNGNGAGNGDGSVTGSDPANARQADPVQADRQLIRTASLEVEVDSFADARSSLTESARQRGGFMTDSEVRTHERDNRTWTRGTLTFRVPSEAFADFYADVEAVGNVTEASTETEDVTDQLVDLEARIQNLETQRDRLRELYEDANETEDVLAVQEELSEVQEEIERLEARRTSLKDRVAYSTVTVTLSEPEPERDRTTVDEDDEPAWHETGVASAFVSSVGGVITVIRAAVVAAAYLAPYLLAFGLPVGLAYAGLRRRRARDERSTASPPISPGTELEDSETDDGATNGRNGTGDGRDDGE